MQSQHELPEVDGAAPVGVEGPEDILAKLVSISTWEHLAVHGDKLVFAELSTGTILQESFVPFLR